MVAATVPASATAPAGAAGPLLAARAVTVRYGPLQALDRVDLTVAPGEVVALAGENGAGKTTLIRCIAGDMAPDSGQILLGGQPVRAGPAAVNRRGVAVVWQDLALCPNLDIAANLLLGQEPRRLLLSQGRLHIAASTLLAELGIVLPDTTRSIRSLSGGQRQLLAVARAMSRKPALLILDEPTASLGVAESAQVEELIAGLRERGATILLVSHDVEQMFRLADRIVVLRHGRVAGSVSPRTGHPDDVVALTSGQRVDSSARHQLTRLHGLVDRLASADPSSSLSLILSALRAALNARRLCIHLVEGPALVCAASLGFPPELLAAWARLPRGLEGGPVGLAAATGEVVVDPDVRTSAAWAPFRPLAASAGVGSSWAVPVAGPGGLVGVVTVFWPIAGRPQRDELDLVTLYAGYAASAVERDRLLEEVTARNRVLETIREVLESLAGPASVADGLAVATRSLRHGLQAAEVALFAFPAGAAPQCRAYAGPAGGSSGQARGASGRTGRGADAPPASLLEAAERAMANAARTPRGGRTQPGGARPPRLPQREDPAAGRDGRAHRVPAGGGKQILAVTFSAPGGQAALVAGWRAGPPTQDAVVLLEDAAHSLRLALEREEAAAAREEAAALRRSQELQRSFLSRLSHELRTPLTAIRGYATSLLQTDVTWDADSQHRFLSRISAESARLGRLVGDLLDFSAIESGILRLGRDWCNVPLVIEAAAACLPPPRASAVDISCAGDLPAIWADHDRLEQVFVNLLDNALRHNPPGTRVRVSARVAGDDGIVVTVLDNGAGLPPEIAAGPFEVQRRRHSRTAGAGFGLSIAKGIVEAHGGRLTAESSPAGTGFHIHLPVEAPGRGAGPARPAAGGDPGTGGDDPGTGGAGGNANV